MIDIKDSIKRRYSSSFLHIIESMLQHNPGNRKKINEISTLIEFFLNEEEIDLSEE